MLQKHLGHALEMLQIVHLDCHSSHLVVEVEIVPLRKSAHS